MYQFCIFLAKQQFGGTFGVLFRKWHENISSLMEQKHYGRSGPGFQFPETSTVGLSTCRLGRRCENFSLSEGINASIGVCVVLWIAFNQGDVFAHFVLMSQCKY